MILTSIDGENVQKPGTDMRIVLVGALQTEDDGDAFTAANRASFSRDRPRQRGRTCRTAGLFRAYTTGLI
ncbi:hypothetical protein ASD31_23320 [Rhizobium sp. Root482]|nr:hypothetical protein ASD31_23320 [Rhizobium sp. Root482]